MRRLWRDGRLVTLAGLSGWGLVERGALLTEGETIVWAGPLAGLPPQGAPAEVAEVIELQGALVTPGLVDCHTHLVYGGDRTHEFEQRLLGASYADIARAGGGIRATVAATRAASEDELFAAAARRARALMAEGVTTLEVKSGYGLDADSEARMLRAARRLASLGLQVRTTSLGAHALPPEATDADAYIAAVCEQLEAQQAAGLVDAVDAFCEHLAFSPAQVARVFDAARALGLPVKLHAEQLSNQHGARLAAGYRALSVDHLEYLDADGIAALAAAGTVAVLLPGAFYALRETRLPPVDALREAGVPIALATDHNPGTSPTLSPLLMMNMACVLFRLTPEEALRGLTVNGALALGLRDRGRLAAGQRADFCLWDVQHPRELAASFGHNPLRQRIFAGMA